MPTNKEKRASFEAAYDQGKVTVIIDLLAEGLDLPEVCLAQGREGYVLLNYSKTYNVPDMKITDEGIFASLLFGQETLPTFVPWGSIRTLGLNGFVIERWRDEPVYQAQGIEHSKWFCTTVGEA